MSDTRGVPGMNLRAATSAVEIFPMNQRWTSHVLHLRTVLSKFSEGRATFDLQHAFAVLNQYHRRT